MHGPREQELELNTASSSMDLETAQNWLSPSSGTASCKNLGRLLKLTAIRVFATTPDNPSSIL